tara:strand:+ start:227 stop:1015 length:789 start_codon:yes stop_codon:yes gene_type:complete
MTGIRDIESGKIYIGIEEPAKLDQAVETLNGDKPYDGTLVATGPSFLGAHKGGFAKATLNVGTALGDWSPGVSGRAVQVEGDVEIIGEEATNTVFIDGDVFVTGAVDCLSKGRLEARHQVADGRPKPFDMVHPSKGKGNRLRYACIEGPEVAVYYRGRLKDSNIIELPSHWKNLVHADSITVQIQNIGVPQMITVESFDNEKIILESNTIPETPIDCFYHVYGERKDVNHLVVEYEGDTWEDYPDPDYDDPQYKTGVNTKTT